jgi:hypothetical protein
MNEVRSGQARVTVPEENRVSADRAVVREVAGVQELQELQNKTIGIVIGEVRNQFLVGWLDGKLFKPWISKGRLGSTSPPTRLPGP